MYTTNQMDRIETIIDMADSDDCMDIYTMAKIAMEARIDEYLRHCYDDAGDGFTLGIDVNHVTDATLEWWTRPGVYTIRTNLDGVIRDFDFPCDTPEQLAASLYSALRATRGEREHVWLDDVLCWALA